MNKQVSYAYQHLSRTETLFKGENKNINISVSKNSPVNASLSLDGYKHSMVQIIALTIALKMKTVIVNPPTTPAVSGALRWAGKPLTASIRSLSRWTVSTQRSWW